MWNFTIFWASWQWPFWTVRGRQSKNPYLFFSQSTARILFHLVISRPSSHLILRKSRPTNKRRVKCKRKQNKRIGSHHFSELRNARRNWEPNIIGSRRQSCFSRATSWTELWVTKYRLIMKELSLVARLERCGYTSNTSLSFVLVGSVWNIEISGISVQWKRG